MASNNDELNKIDGKSAIQEFYSGATVFITGGTGFMGKVLTEKLLRSCPDVAEIILLVRSKKDKSCYERLDNIFDEALFSQIGVKCRHKVTVVNGDCSLPDLGLSVFDRTNLTQKVEVVFHGAATVRFDEPLSHAVAVNVQGTKAMLDLAKQMTKLKAFVHVSTVYANCHLPEIEEKFYPPYYDGDKVMKLVDCLEKPDIDQLTPTLLKDMPNTYSYTKCLAEDLIKNYSKGMPVAVFRPSIIVATKQEPLCGWIDNMYGPTGILVFSAMGMLPSLHCHVDFVTDIVPVDMAINALMATAWQVHSDGCTLAETTTPKVYNYVSSPERPIDWSTFWILSLKHWKNTVHDLWYPFIIWNSFGLVHTVQFFLQVTLPCWLINVAARLVGKQSNIMKLSQKAKKLSQLTTFFTTRQWKFHNDNVRRLWDSLGSADRQLFPFSFSDHKWDSFIEDYMLGIRLYVLKDDTSKLGMARTWLRQLCHQFQSPS